MSKILLGDDYLLWVKVGGMADYAAIDGQGTLTDTRSQTKISTASKNKRGYNTSAYGNIEISMDLDIQPTLPDPAYSAFESACNVVPREPFMIQVRGNGVDGVEADSIFTCSVYGSIASRTFTQDGAVAVKGGFAIADAPTVDQLS
jgi:hypothetical protein